MPTISVIVPVYNVEKYLRCCVDSILAQTFTDIEVLLVDDGSTDGSSAICDAYAKIDNRVRVFHKANGGVSSARNMGLDEAVGKWIMFVDSDDKVDPLICERLLEYASEGCMPMCTYFRWTDRELLRSAIQAEPQIVHSIQKFSKISIPGPVVRLYDRNVIKQNNLTFTEGFSFAEDAIFNYEYYGYLSSFIIIDEPLYYYRILTKSLSHGKYIPEFELIINKLYDKRLTLAKKLNADNESFYWEYYANYFYSINVLLENNMHKDAPGTWYEKMRRNNALIRSDEFKLAFPYRYERPKDFSKRYIHMLEFSYHTGSYFWLWLVGVPGKIKHVIFRKK